MSNAKALAVRQKLDDAFEVGIDEAGRGPLFGRVYAAAVVLPQDCSKFEVRHMKDSKKFSSTKRICEARDHIKECAEAWAVEWCDEETVDSENIRNATFLAMHKCVKTILTKLNRPCFDKIRLLVDGDAFKPYVEFDAQTNKHGCIPHECVKHGDNTYCSIAAASVLAKTARDDYVESLCVAFPALDSLYSLRSNKGYGTKAHLDAIREHGVSPWHRKSYGPCKAAPVSPQFLLEPSPPEPQQSQKNN